MHKPTKPDHFRKRQVRYTKKIRKKQRSQGFITKKSIVYLFPKYFLWSSFCFCMTAYRIENVRLSNIVFQLNLLFGEQSSLLCLTRSHMHEYSIIEWRTKKDFFLHHLRSLSKCCSWNYKLSVQIVLIHSNEKCKNILCISLTSQTNVQIKKYTEMLDFLKQNVIHSIKCLVFRFNENKYMHLSILYR